MKKTIIRVLLTLLLTQTGFAQLSFPPPVTYPVSSPTSTIEAGNLNGNSEPDFVVPNGNFLRIYFDIDDPADQCRRSYVGGIATWGVGGRLALILQFPKKDHDT